MTGLSLSDFRDDTALDKFSQIKLVAELFVEGAHVFFRSIHRKTDMAQGLDGPLSKSDVKAVLINHRGNGFGISSVRNGFVGKFANLSTQPVIIKIIGGSAYGH